MKYGPDLQKRILEELKEYPIIRIAVKKVDLHHSTFYRWLDQHPTFHKQVIAAMEIGRDHVAEIAESKLIQHVQNGDMGAIKYLLSHNSQRYMSVEKSDQQSIIGERRVAMLKTPIREGEDLFEEIYKHMYLLETLDIEMEKIDVWLDAMFGFLWEADPDMKEIFLSGYPDWRKKETLKRKEELRAKELEADRKAEQEIIDSLDDEDDLRHPSKGGRSGSNNPSK